MGRTLMTRRRHTHILAANPQKAAEERAQPTQSAKGGYRPNCVYGIRGLPSIRKGKVGVYMLWEHVGWLLPGILLVVVYVIPSS